MKYLAAEVRVVSLFVAGLLFVVSAPFQNASAQKTQTNSTALLQVTLVGRVLAAPDPLMNYGGSLDCHFEEFLFGAESNGEQRKNGITPVEIVFCYYGDEGPLGVAFFDYSKLFKLHVYRTCGGDNRLKDVAYRTEMLDSTTGKKWPPVMGMQVLDGAPKDLLKPDLLFPYYELRSDGFKVLSQDTNRGARTPNSALVTTPAPSWSIAGGQFPEPPCKSAAPLLTGDDDGKPLWLTTEQLLERASHCETPTYPVGILYEGTVTISVLVDEKGEVSCAKAVDGHPKVVAVALDAARKWKFKPMTKRDRPAAFYGTLDFRFSSVSTSLKSNSCLEVQPPLDVTMVQLIADPEKFDGRLIRVIGFLRLEYEGDVLYLHREDYENAILGDGIWVDVSSEIKQQSKTLNMNYVLLEGVFSSGDRGHMDMWSGAIKKIRRAEVWPLHPRQSK